MRKWMVEFLKKFESHGIKIARVNSILYFKFTLILYGVMVSCDRVGFSVHSQFIEKSLYHR